MADRLKDKVAIITGATSGIGWATAVLFVKEGAKVVFAGRRDEKGKVLEEELKNLGGDVLFVKTDVTKKSDLDRLVKKTIDCFGRIDILVNNAGILTEYAFTDMDEEKDFDEIFNVNVKSYFLLTQKVLPYMLKQKKGAIVNTSSIGGEVGVPMHASYSASKGAVKMFTRSLAIEYANQGIRINSIMPGLTNSDMVPVGGEFEQMAVKLVPMGRAASPEEIAPGVLFLASDEASFCTGIHLIIDGGATCK